MIQSHKSLTTSDRLRIFEEQNEKEKCSQKVAIASDIVLIEKEKNIEEMSESRLKRINSNNISISIKDNGSQGLFNSIDHKEKEDESYNIQQNIQSNKQEDENYNEIKLLDKINSIAATEGNKSSIWNQGSNIGLVSFNTNGRVHYTLIIYIL